MGGIGAAPDRSGCQFCPAAKIQQRRGSLRKRLYVQVRARPGSGWLHRPDAGSDEELSEITIEEIRLAAPPCHPSDSHAYTDCKSAWIKRVEPKPPGTAESVHRALNADAAGMGEDQICVRPPMRTR
jgi:hypothetical protein